MLNVKEANEVLHKVGLASLGASHEEMEKLSAAYWYTFEVGLCMDEKTSEKKILGGAVLSSLEESKIALS